MNSVEEMLNNSCVTMAPETRGVSRNGTHSARPADNMFIFLLLLAQVQGEWVEISQNHYRKPLRTYSIHGDNILQKELDKTINANRIYGNYSLSDHTSQPYSTWVKGNVNKVPKIGNVKRVILDTNSVKAPSVDYNSNNLLERPKTVNDIKNPSASVIEDSDIFINDKSSSNDDFKRNKNNINRFFMNSSKILPISDKERSEFSLNNNNFQNNVRKNKPTNSSLSQTVDSVTTEQTHIKDIFIQTNNKKTHKFLTNSLTTKATDIFTYSTGLSDDQTHKKTTSLSLISSQIDAEIKNKIQENKITHIKEQDITSENLKNEKIVNKFGDLNQNDEESYVDDEEVNEPHPVDDKIGNLHTLMKIIKVVGDTIRKNTRRSVGSKTRYLNRLKDTILTTIEEQIDSLWPDDVGEESRVRQQRSTASSPRGHLQIPSSESALMSISFLTFAVFLIKLVLQIIQAYKNKTMFVAPAVVATVGRTAANAGK